MNILITGANGNIGKKLQLHFSRSDNDFSIVCLDRSEPDKGSEYGKNYHQIDLSHWSDDLVQVMQGVDAVIHLAADPHENKSWDELLESNLDATFNLFTVATLAHVPRVVLASSNHVMGGYRTERGVGKWLSSNLPPKPGTKLVNVDGTITDSTAYAAMKLAAERMGATYAMAAKAICIAIRIGWVNPIGQNRPQDLPEEADIWFKQMWLSDRDLGQLFEKSVTADMPPAFYLINGMSNNEDMVWDILSAEKLLGYVPVDALKRGT
jgi:NAD+ dependent glucose-6-phosphate dehydrogenase